MLIEVDPVPHPNVAESLGADRVHVKEPLQDTFVQPEGYYVYYVVHKHFSFTA